MTDPVAWDLAERVAVRVAGREPFADSYHRDSLVPDFAELTAEAEEIVAEETGLRSLSGAARARVTDRAGWVRANVAAFRRMLHPLTDRLGERLDPGSVGAKVTRSVAALEVGTLLGWMSTRVLGQYDLLIVDDETAEEQDLVYYVGPNVLAIEKQYGFPPREFRLWLAIHEVTHRAQFTGVPWLRPHFLELVQRTLSSVDPDPKRILEGLKRAVDDLRGGRNPLDEGGLVTIFASADQRDVLQQIGGMMSLLEGHGDVTMDRAAVDRIPSAERFSRVLKQRRARSSPGARLLQQLVGLEAKLNQYAQGEAFIHAVEVTGGRALLDLVWVRAEHLPSLEEIRDPARWVERMAVAVP